jgi:hypothetical protein
VTSTFGPPWKAALIDISGSLGVTELRPGAVRDVFLFGSTAALQRDIGNLAAADLSQITRAVKCKLKMLQYRPEVIDGCLAGTGMTLNK